MPAAPAGTNGKVKFVAPIKVKGIEGCKGCGMSADFIDAVIKAFDAAADVTNFFGRFIELTAVDGLFRSRAHFPIGDVRDLVVIHIDAGVGNGRSAVLDADFADADVAFEGDVDIAVGPLQYFRFL